MRKNEKRIVEPIAADFDSVVAKMVLPFNRQRKDEKPKKEEKVNTSAKKIA